MANLLVIILIAQSSLKERKTYYALEDVISTAVTSCSEEVLRCGSPSIQNLHFVIIVPADVLAPKGAKPSAGTLLTTYLDFILLASPCQLKISDTFFAGQTMMTSSNGNIFRVIVPLCVEFTGDRWIPRTKDQWRGALMFSLICAWINGRVNNRESGDLRRRGAHYDVTVMQYFQKGPARSRESRNLTF